VSPLRDDGAFASQMSTFIVYYASSDFGLPPREIAGASSARINGHVATRRDANEHKSHVGFNVLA